MRNIYNLKSIFNLKLKAYSLLEVVITLLVMNVVILMLSNIMVLSLKLSLQAHERSFAREEMTSITNQIRIDFANATSVSSDCQDSSVCTLNNEAQIIRWEICNNTDINGNAIYSICRKLINGSEEEIQFISSNKLNFGQNGLRFEVADGITIDVSTTKTTILLTLQASHINETMNLQNIYRQTVVSTRNF